MVVIRLKHALYNPVPPEGTMRKTKDGKLRIMHNGRWETIETQNKKVDI